MNIIIIGGGKLGANLTNQLSKENHNIVLIDKDYDTVESIINTYDIQGVVGDGSICSVLSEAGVKNTNLVISVTASDDLNILNCLISKKMGAKHCIARVRNIEYAKQLAFMRDELGLSMMVNPDYDTAIEISRTLRTPSAINVETFAKNRAEMAEIKVDEKNPLVGLKLMDISSKFKANILVCAIQRKDEVFIPNGNSVLEVGDKIHFTASHSQISKFFKALGIFKDPIHSIMIIGGGRIAYYLAEQLGESGLHVKIVERDRERCVELSEMLPDAQVICADGSDSDVLDEEGIDKVDAVVTLTDIDEENIIISMYAQSKEVRKVVTKINRTATVSLLEAIGNDTIVSPKTVATNTILQYVRARQNSTGIKVKTLYKLADGKFEAAEFVVDKDISFTNIPLAQLKLKKNILLACIIRGSKIIIPRGDDVIKMKDRVIVVTADKILHDLEEIIEE